jgi:hypothetical protein
MESNFLFVVFLSIDMNGGGGAGGSPSMGGGARVVGSPEGVAHVHGTRCEGAFYCFSGKSPVCLPGTKMDAFCLLSLLLVGLKRLIPSTNRD